VHPGLGKVAFQPWFTFWAASVKSKPRVHEVTGLPRLVIARSPWKPPCQLPRIWYLTVQPAEAADAGASVAARPPATISAPAAARDSVRFLIKDQSMEMSVGALPDSVFATTFVKCRKHCVNKIPASRETLLDHRRHRSNRSIRN